MLNFKGAGQFVSSTILHETHFVPDVEVDFFGGSENINHVQETIVKFDDNHWQAMWVPCTHSSENGMDGEVVQLMVANFICAVYDEFRSSAWPWNSIIVAEPQWPDPDNNRWVSEAEIFKDQQSAEAYVLSLINE